MSKTIIMIMGKSGCGKSTLERGLIKRAPDIFKKVISSTTRPKRPGETDGEDYYFLTPGEFDDTEFIQTTFFAGRRYGSSVAEYATPHTCPILVVVPEIARTFTEILNKRFPQWDIFYVFFDISNERLKENMRTRGDTEEMIETRISQDSLDKDYKNTGIHADYVVYDEDLNDKLPINVHNEISFSKYGWNSSQYRELLGLKNS